MLAETSVAPSGWKVHQYHALRMAAQNGDRLAAGRPPQSHGPVLAPGEDPLPIFAVGRVVDDAIMAAPNVQALPVRNAPLAEWSHRLPRRGATAHPDGTSRR